VNARFDGMVRRSSGFIDRASRRRWIDRRPALTGGDGVCLLLVVLLALWMG
jgi:hypothetical protein